MDTRSHSVDLMHRVVECIRVVVRTIGQPVQLVMRHCPYDVLTRMSLITHA